VGAITKEMITFAHSKEKKNEFDQYYRQNFRASTAGVEEV
jgi:hypothetical protein